MTARKCLCLPLLLLLLLAGCAAKPAQADDDAARAGSIPETGRVTLMIYMIGSDLESKSSAASLDLQELAQSGVDLSGANVVVCAGGAQTWYTDAVQPDRLTELVLGETGFSAVSSLPAVSMGESAVLSDFLCRCVERCPAERYALVLWDHGGGPLLGFGRDVCFGGDTLTLPELREALEASPFCAERKLAWIGFDACLMASAELVSVCADYADYLVASQELEPALGWDYGAFAALADEETEPFLRGLTARYLASCEDYYARRGFGSRATTLSCLKLSGAGALEDALGALFHAAGADLGENYNRLAARRAKTYMPGFASGGASYDLVDVGDMAAQLAPLYPSETSRVQQALESLVTANAANVPNCCGVSLYYPFFNPGHYRSGWGEQYHALGVHADYDAYLEGFGTRLLGAAPPPVAYGAPLLTGEGEYSLWLTEAQAEQLAAARFSILRRVSGETYARVFTGGNVAYDESIRELRASFDGRVLCLHSGDDGGYYPVSVLRGTAGSCEIYTVPVDLERGEDASLRAADYQIAVDRQTGSAEVLGLLALEPESALQPGKAEELAPENGDTLLFPHLTYARLLRDESGRVLPIEEWSDNRVYAWRRVRAGEDVSFSYEPLSDGDYAIVFELTTTHGERFCSEPAPVDADWDMPETRERAPTEIPLSGERTVLYTDADCTVSMVFDRETKRCMLEMENRGAHPLRLTQGNPKRLICNGQIDCSDGEIPTVTAQPGETARSASGFRFGDAAAFGQLGETRSMTFSLSLTDQNTRDELWQKRFLVRFSGDARPDGGNTPAAPEPYLGASAGEQVLMQNDAAEIRLLRFGSGAGGSGSALLRIENRGRFPLCAAVDAVSVNAVSQTAQLRVSRLPAGAVAYRSVRVRVDDFLREQCGVRGVAALSLSLRTCTDEWAFSMGYGDVVSCPVSLSQQSDSHGAFLPGDRTLYEADGVRIALKGVNLRPTDTSGLRWYLSIENDTDQAFRLELAAAKSGEQALLRPPIVHNGAVGAGERAVCTIRTEEETLPLSVQFRLASFSGDAIVRELPMWIALPGK